MAEGKILRKIIESSERFVLPALILTTLLMALQLFVKINRYAVNILFSDQWDTYQPIFNGANFWQVFTAQAGQLRLGVGGLACDFVARATDWNTRAESFFIGLTMVLIAVVAIYLKWRLFKTLTFWDLLIPMICLSATQTEVPLLVPFPSHSTVPILLLLIYLICLTFEHPAIRFGILSLVNFLTLFTGWGIFIGFLTPILAAYLMIFRRAENHRKNDIWAGAAILLSILSLVFYFHDYTVYSGVECFTLPHFPLLDYLWFATLMLSNSAGFSCGKRIVLAEILGALLVFIFAVALAGNFWQLLREKKLDEKKMVIVILLGFSALFLSASTVGRVCLGECAATAGRYQALLVPAWLGLYFAAATLKTRVLAQISLPLLVLCFIIPQLRNAAYETSSAQDSELKIQWKNCYLAKENAEICDQEIGMSIFKPVPSVKAQDRIDYLKERHLNFFADR